MLSSTTHNFLLFRINDGLESISLEKNKTVEKRSRNPDRRTEERTRFVSSQISEHRRLLPAKAILLSADGYDVKDVARKLGLNQKAVTLMCKR